MPRKENIPSRDALFDAGLLSPGMLVQIIKRPESSARIVDKRHVNFNGRTITFNEWAIGVTGWKGASLFSCARILNGPRFSDLRDKLHVQM